MCVCFHSYFIVDSKSKTKIRDFFETKMLTFMKPNRGCLISKLILVFFKRPEFIFSKKSFLRELKFVVCLVELTIGLKLRYEVSSSSFNLILIFVFFYCKRERADSRWRCYFIIMIWFDSFCFLGIFGFSKEKFLEFSVSLALSFSLLKVFVERPHKGIFRVFPYFELVATDLGRIRPGPLGPPPSLAYVHLG